MRSNDPNVSNDTNVSNDSNTQNDPNVSNDSNDPNDLRLQESQQLGIKCLVLLDVGEMRRVERHEP